MARDKTAYDMQYAKEHITKKVVDFNDKNEVDVFILEWLRSNDIKFAPYVKKLIIEDVDRKKRQSGALDFM